MSDALQTVVPVATLLLGTWIGWLLKRVDTRRAAQIDAGDTLAEVPRYMWTRGADGDYLNLQVFLGRLRIRLKAAEVPAPEIATLVEAVTKAWSGLHQAEGPDSEYAWTMDSELLGAAERATDDVQAYLLASWRRRRALSRAKGRD